MEFINHNVVWKQMLGRDVNDWEIPSSAGLSERLKRSHPRRCEDDKREWKGEASEVFTIRSCYEIIS